MILYLITIFICGLLLLGMYTSNIEDMHQYHAFEKISVIHTTANSYYISGSSNSATEHDIKADYDKINPDDRPDILLLFFRCPSKCRRLYLAVILHLNFFYLVLIQPFLHTHFR